ncbi:Endothelin-converting enzyme 1 [Stylophora pistillata]|uniref:Endothelin-converting enzyme 1 n=1 Tax=Stylophora pistillata TaxID=50429 RepID=A0A2B4SJP7_STYPI|nr:Endothelin-converting enzyme 1 [Stylophora pistillata]
MDSHRSKIDAEPGFTTSTMSLGVHSQSSGSIFYSKRRKKVTMGLIFTSVALLLVCIALAVCLVVVSSRDQEKDMGNADGKNGHKQMQCTSDACLAVASAVKKSINESVDPCEDFFHYSCDGWIKHNPIPPSLNWFSTFGKLAKLNSEKMLLLLLQNDDLPREHAVSKTRNYFKSCMAEEEIEKTSLNELKNLITRFGSWPLGLSVNPFNSSKRVLQIMPPTLSLIREKYLAPENKTRLAYLKFMTKVGKLLGGGNDTRDQMAEVMELEARLANITPPRSVLIQNYHRHMNISELERQAPGFKFTWLQYINDVLRPFNVWVNATDSILVPSPEYLKGLSSIVNETDKRILSNYMMWTFVRAAIPYLSRDFRAAKLEYEKEVEGKKSATPRWLYCVEEMNGYYHGLTFALGYIYVTNAFDSEVIPLIQEMMSTIRKTFRDETSRDDWIDEQTRQKIIEKEKAMKNNVGFPKLCSNETLLNEYYKDVNISRSNYLRNAMDVTKWRRRSQFSILKTPVDKEQWYFGPQLVNAFYLPNRNEINILAGILQPPFYYGRKAPRAVNFGAIGMVLGHELSHGFDALGRYFNENGEMTDDWWSAETSQKFLEKSKCIVNQYNNYSVDGENGPIHINGELSLSENIADNGGIRLAYWGYKDWVKKNGAELQLPGLIMTNDQLLFVSFAQMWCSAFTPAAAYVMASTDTHALANYRVIGSLSNMKEFSDVFKCPSGSRMNPEKKCKIW